MNESKIAVRYAKSFYEFTSQKNELENAKKDMELIQNTISSINDFNILFDSPLLKTFDKSKVLKTIFKNKVSPITVSFLDLIVDNKRESEIKNIIRNFLELYRKKQGVKKATLTSAIELNNTIIDNIKNQISKELNTKIELEQVINKNIIGGFILRIDDKQIDTSVKKSLQEIKKSLQDVNVSTEISI